MGGPDEPGLSGLCFCQRALRRKPEIKKRRGNTYAPDLVVPSDPHGGRGLFFPAEPFRQCRDGVICPDLPNRTGWDPGGG